MSITPKKELESRVAPSNIQVRVILHFDHYNLNYSQSVAVILLVLFTSSLSYITGYIHSCIKFEE